ncbi:MAG: tetraacyldisaccharide 4'-kinase, partial [Gammaproteobacteria bacterium]|nr:tetraacyldisaccharide 4'-kinase [Gammaproteobacteria bacterium]
SGFLRRAADRRPLNFRLCPGSVCRLDGSEQRRIEEFAGRTVHAVAGIGNPESFFRMLEAYGISVTRHPLPDHAEIRPDDIDFDDGLPVFMTEKDAVKCRWLDTQNCWDVSVDVVFDDDDGDVLAQHVIAAIRVKDRRTAS